MKKFITYPLLCLQLYSTVSAETVAGAPAAEAYVSKNSSCLEYSKQRPDLAGDLDLSGNSSMNSIPLRQRAKLCMDGVLAAWKDTVKELLVDPYVYMTKTAPAQTKAFLDNCNKSEICKNQLFYEAYGRLPSAEENKKLNSSMSFSDLDILYRNAKSRMNSTGEQNRRLRNELLNRKWLEDKPVDRSEVLNSSQEDASIWSALKDILNQEKQKWSCLKPEAAQELFCYYLAQIIDPTIAAGVISKAPKLAKLASFVSKSDKTKDISKGLESIADVVSQENIATRISSKSPKTAAFVKDQPTLAYKITSDKFEDIPLEIRKHLGSIDNTKYTPEYLKENMGSAIALQMKDGVPDFYIIGRSTFDSKYATVSINDVAAKNPKYFSAISGATENLVGNPGIIAVRKTATTNMIKMSDLGYKIDEPVTIKSPWGEQTKPSGQDAFLVYDESKNQYYMVNVDINGNPISYIPSR